MEYWRGKTASGSWLFDNAAELNNSTKKKYELARPLRTTVYLFTVTVFLSMTSFCQWQRKIPSRPKAGASCIENFPPEIAASICCSIYWQFSISSIAIYNLIYSLLWPLGGTIDNPIACGFFTSALALKVITGFRLVNNDEKSYLAGRGHLIKNNVRTC